MAPNQKDRSELPVSATNSEEGGQLLQQRPVGLTITLEKIDRVLTDVQARIKHLRRYNANLGLEKLKNWPAWKPQVRGRMNDAPCLHTGRRSMPSK
jgi:hypothetical protein